MDQLQYIEIKNASVMLGGRVVLREINWRLSAGESWGFFGGNGSGKSTLLRLARGDLWHLWSEDSSRIYGWNGKTQETPIGVRDRIGLVSPEQQEAFIQNEWDIAVRDAIATGLTDTVYLNRRLSAAEEERLDGVIRQLNITPFEHQRTLELSQGQLRKLLVARALIRDPLLLILDEVCNGLDAEFRSELIERIEALSIPILYASHREDEIPSTLTHALYMKDGRIERTEILARNERVASKPVTKPDGDWKKWKDGDQQDGVRSPLIGIQNTDIWLGETKILHNINWTMFDDENWAVVGANGSGKSTLLRLIYGELHPALGGEIYRYGALDHRAVFDIRAHIGYVSFAAQAGYHPELCAEDVVCSGYFSSNGIYQPVDERQRGNARRWMDEMGVSHLAQRPFGNLSYGESRRVLIARAMVHEPKLLLLDEPFDGLDKEALRETAALIDRLARGETRIMLVTHHWNELVPAVNRMMELKKGKIAKMWRRGQSSSQIH